MFLDEPTAGLDPRARRATWDVIGGLKVAGATVLLTTHYLDEAESLADRIGILDRGRLVALGDLESLRGGGDPVVRLVASPAIDPADLLGLDQVRGVRSDPGGVLQIETDDPRPACRGHGLGARSGRPNPRDPRRERDARRDLPAPDRRGRRGMTATLHLACPTAIGPFGPVGGVAAG